MKKMLLSDLTRKRAVLISLPSKCPFHESAITPYYILQWKTVLLSGFLPNKNGLARSRKAATKLLKINLKMRAFSSGVDTRKSGNKNYFTEKMLKFLMSVVLAPSSQARVVQ